jgi:hypothetical protein
MVVAIANSVKVVAPRLGRSRQAYAAMTSAIMLENSGNSDKGVN